jgi:hypothetical protein
MAKKKSSIPKFMKYAGSIQGPPDLSSRRGFETGPNGEGRKPPVLQKKQEKKETQQAASLR